MHARLVDAAEVLITDDQFTAAQPLVGRVESLARQKILPLLANGNAVVTQGFIGRTEDGSITTIGRGGSGGVRTATTGRRITAAGGCTVTGRPAPTTLLRIGSARTMWLTGALANSR